MWPFKKEEPITKRVDDKKEPGIIDVNSETWATVIDWCHRERNQLMVSNNNMNHGLPETAFLRGQIKAIERVLEIPGKPSWKGKIKNG